MLSATSSLLCSIALQCCSTAYATPMEGIPAWILAPKCSRAFSQPMARDIPLWDKAILSTLFPWTFSVYAQTWWTKDSETFIDWHHSPERGKLKIPEGMRKDLDATRPFLDILYFCYLYIHHDRGDMQLSNHIVRARKRRPPLPSKWYPQTGYDDHDITLWRAPFSRFSYRYRR